MVADLIAMLRSKYAVTYPCSSQLRYENPNDPWVNRLEINDCQGNRVLLVIHNENVLDVGIQACGKPICANTVELAETSCDKVLRFVDAFLAEPSLIQQREERIAWLTELEARG